MTPAPHARTPMKGLSAWRGEASRHLRLLPLAAEHFTHPGPDFLAGLHELKEKIATYGE